MQKRSSPRSEKSVVLDSDADARARTDGTLEALSESIPRGLAENIAEQLPEELAEHLLVEETEDANPPDYEASLSQVSETADFDRGFVERVSDREDVDAETAREHVRKVATGLDSLAPPEMQRARGQLGPDHSSLG